jgi:hypothetical protein
MYNQQCCISFKIVDYRRKRIIELAGNGAIRIRHEFNTPEEFLAMGAYNTAELERIEAVNPVMLPRLWNLTCLFLVEALPPFIRMSEDPKTALRQFLQDTILKPNTGWEKIRQTARVALADKGFTPEQLELMYMFFDAWPYVMIDEIVESVIPLYLIPKTESDKLTGILIEMLREVRNADRN